MRTDTKTSVSTPILPVSSATISPQAYVVLASAIASIGGILFGYDIGIISGALLLLRKEYDLDNFQQEVVVCSMLVGSFVGSFFGGNIVDQFGRKNAIILSSIVFIVGALVLSFSVSYSMIVSGRLILGFGVSVSVTAECTYISEISPPDRRGMLVSLNEMGITCGFLLAYLLNYLFILNPHGWRYMFGAAVVPALLQMVGIICMPKSPHYLLLKGQVVEAESVLKRLRKTSNLSDELAAIQSALSEEKNRRYTDLLSSVNNMRGRLFLGLVLVFCQQFTGQANVLYYAPTVFQLFGYCSDSSATLVTVGLGVVKVLSTIFTVLTVDKFGRRCLLLVGGFLMTISITTLGIIALTITHTYSCKDRDASKEVLITKQSSLDNEEQPLLNVTSATTQGLDLATKKQDEFSISSSFGNETFHEDGDVQVSRNDNSLVAKLISVISLMTFVCAYGISYGPVTWLILSEIFPTSLRGRAISLATSANWGSNLIVSLTFLNLLDAVGAGATFMIYGCLCAAACVFLLLFIPETKNKSLEEISRELSKGFIQRQSISCCTPGCCGK